MTTLLELGRIREEFGLAPVNSLLYLGLGLQPLKENAIKIDPNNLPSQWECCSVAGLDVILFYYGHRVSYGPLRKLSHLLEQSRPRRLQLIDLDYKRIAFLKVAGV